MGNRSRYVAVTAAAAGAAAVVARRRARLRRAAEGIRDAIQPTHVADLPSDRVPVPDEAHAPGHRHLRRAADERPPPPSRDRAGTRSRRDMWPPASAD